MKKKNKNKGITVIKKANQLIEARYKFDVWETRFFLSLLSFIRREDQDFKPYRIWYRDVIKTFGLKSNQSYDLLREAGRSLMRKTFKISSEEQGFKRETEYHIIRTVNYLAEGQNQKGVESQEYIDVTFEPEMKPLLLQLQRNFTAYDLRNIVKLGTYPVRVYELLKQYEVIGNRKLRIDELKRMFELTDEYPLFANFYQRIIKPSIRDINKYTDIAILEVKRIKEGRKIVALNFIFEAKNKAQLKELREQPIELLGRSGDKEVVVLEQNTPNEEQGTPKDRLFKQFHDEVIVKLGVSPSTFLGLLDDCTEEDVELALKLTRRAKTNGGINNPAGYFVKALREKYADSIKVEERRKEQKKEIAQQVEKLEIHKLYLKEERGRKINEQIKKLTDDDPAITEKAIEEINKNPLLKAGIDRKEEELQRPLAVDDYRKDEVLRGMVIAKIMELFPTSFEDIQKRYDQKIRRVEQQMRALK